MTQRQVTIWTFLSTTVALFMVVLDNLVVSTAIPVIRVDLGASLEQLEWTVNAYTLTFAAFLLTGAALGDRFGRRRVFMIGIAIFTAASAGAALAPSAEWLIAARAIQGIGGAIVTPLTLTLLSAAVPASKRGAALGVWSGVAGLAVASGPLVGGAVVEGLSWQWIFWLNVPIGLVLLPIASRLQESYGPDKALDLAGLGLASAGLLSLTWGIINGHGHGWSSPEIVGALSVGAVLLAAFVLWERRMPEPMLPMRFFENRAFSAANAASLFMYFGMFGSIFLLTQFFQTAQGYSPLEAGLRVLPWTAMPLIVAPIAGRALGPASVGGRSWRSGSRCRRSGSRGSPRSRRSRRSATRRSSRRSSSPVSGWACSSPRWRTSCSRRCGAGRRARRRVPTTRSARLEACSAWPCSHRSSPATAATSRPETFNDGIVPALWVGAVVVALGSLSGLLIPRKVRGQEVTASQSDTVAEAA